MVRAGALPAGTQLVGVVGGNDTWAQVEPDGHLRLPTGETFRKVDDAGRTVTGKRCDGMGFWQMVRPDGTRISLRQLRDEVKVGSRRA
jgi:CubicO group peptidase (beta-lactamase class C family)